MKMCAYMYVSAMSPIIYVCMHVRMHVRVCMYITNPCLYLIHIYMFANIYIYACMHVCI